MHILRRLIKEGGFDRQSVPEPSQGFTYTNPQNTLRIYANKETPAHEPALSSMTSIDCDIDGRHLYISFLAGSFITDLNTERNLPERPISPEDYARYSPQILAMLREVPALPDAVIAEIMKRLDSYDGWYSGSREFFEKMWFKKRAEASHKLSLLIARSAQLSETIAPHDAAIVQLIKETFQLNHEQAVLWALERGGTSESYEKVQPIKCEPNYIDALRRRDMPVITISVNSQRPYYIAAEIPPEVATSIIVYYCPMPNLHR
jgi:hypothetical protein